MNIKESFISVFTNWKNFSGRACRSEFWYFQLSITLITWLLMIPEVLTDTYNYEIAYGPLSLLFTFKLPLTFNEPLTSTVSHIPIFLVPPCSLPTIINVL